MKRVAIWAMFLAAPAMAAAGGSASAQFKSLDTDQDGYVSVKEATAHGELFNAFRTFDKDQDGRLSPAEFAKADVPAAKAEGEEQETAKTAAEETDQQN